MITAYSHVTKILYLITITDIMKTKLLRNLREEAYKEYGIKKKIDLPKTGFDVLDEKVEGIYIIGHRFNSNRDVVELNLKDAKKRLMQMRIDYCIRRVKEKRISDNRIRFCRL